MPVARHEMVYFGEHFAWLLRAFDPHTWLRADAAATHAAAVCTCSMGSSLRNRAPTSR